MDKNYTVKKPIYKYKPISYYTNISEKYIEEEEEKEEKEEEENEEEVYNYIIDEEKLNKLKILKETQEINIKENEKNKIDSNNYISKSKLIKDNKEIIQDNNSSNMKNNLLKINNLIDLNKKETKENLEKSKLFHSSNILNCGFTIDNNKNKFTNDFKEKDNKKIENKLKNKKLKQKTKKIIAKKKGRKELSENFKNNLNHIIKIQSAWRFYKSKIKLKLFRLIKSLENKFKNKKIEHFKYLFVNLKKIKSEKICKDNKLLNELLKKGKKYDMLNNKYEKVLKELNEIKNKLARKQNLNMINNKNQNISINIISTKENKGKNNLAIEKRNKIFISGEKNIINDKTIYKYCNLFELLKRIRKINLRYYFIKFVFLLTRISNSKIKEVYNRKNNFLITKEIKSISIIKKNLEINERDVNTINAKYQKNFIFSNQISFYIKPVKNNLNKKYKIIDLNIQKQCSIELKVIEKYDLQISDKNEREKFKKKVINKIDNYIIHKVKNFCIFKDEHLIENHIINYLKKKNYFFEKIRKFFDLKLDCFNDKNLCINKIYELKYDKSEKKSNLICRVKKNHFCEIDKLVINKIINNFKIIKIKGKELIINKLSSNNISIIKKKYFNNINIIPKKEKMLFIERDTKMREELIFDKINCKNEFIKGNNLNKSYINKNLIITRVGNEFFMRTKRKKKLKKKKFKKFKNKNLFISDYNQLFIKRNKSNIKNIIIKEDINNYKNVEEL